MWGENPPHLPDQISIPCAVVTVRLISIPCAVVTVRLDHMEGDHVRVIWWMRL